MAVEEHIKRKFDLLAPLVDERVRRLVAGAEAEAIGYGGASIVARATGLARGTVTAGQKELRTALPQEVPLAKGKRVRRPGGGRKRTVETDPTLLRDLEKLVEPVTRGDPESPLRWTCKSLRRLRDELRAMGHQTSHRMVGELLRDLGYSLQANRKTLEGGDHPDRDEQFRYINDLVEEVQTWGDPTISVDTKKKELVGDFKNAGREWRPKGDPAKVRVHDFKIEELGRVAPYGVYDIGQNEGWVSVGVDHDTAEFAVETIRRWWRTMGREAHPKAQHILITADGGGSNGSRLRLWKVELQRLVDELGLPVTVCHFPPGTSKWNKIEHRMFSFITQNWRGRPLISREVVVNLIASTTTRTGLRVKAELDVTKYETGRRVTDRELDGVNILRHDFHGEWNYAIFPTGQDV